MEEEKKDKKLYIIISILSVIILLLVGYIIFDKVQSNNDDNNNKNAETETNTNTNTNVNTEPKTGNFVSKLDDSKDWVYDAEYKKDVKSESYVTMYNETYYAKDIIAPFININSSYANSANKEIKEVFDAAILKYNEGVSDKRTYIEEFEYEKYINNNSLSVILTYGFGATDVVHPKYYTYNIDLETGNQISYTDLYTIAGFNTSNIDSKVEKAIAKKLQEELKDMNYPKGTNFDTFNNQSISNYKKSVSNNTLKYFLSNDGKLNIVVNLYIPAGTGEFDKIITVE